ncbi:MAG: hypothetical protein Fur0041_16790 [Bacteroidia bacterium]
MLVISIVLPAQDLERLRTSLAQLPHAGSDTERVKLLNNIAWDTAYSNLYAGVEYGKQSLHLAEENNYTMGIILSCNTLGTIYSDMGDYNTALEYHLKSLKLCEEKGYIGNSATSYMNLSLVYNGLGNEKKSFESLVKASKIFDSQKNKKGLCVCYSNLGAAFLEADSLEKSKFYYSKALDLAFDLKKPVWQAHAMIGLGQCYAYLNDADRGLILMHRGLSILDSLQDDYERCMAYASMGSVMSHIGKYEEALDYYMKAINLTQDMGLRDERKEDYREISEIYHEMGNDEKAVFYRKKYLELKDSLVNEDVLKHQELLETRYENEKKENEIRLLKQEQSLRKWYITGLVAGVVFLILFFIMLYKQNQFRNQTNRELTHQNAIIEEKNRNITDSINYASRIQKAVSPDASWLCQEFSDAFVLFKPRDIVSGDFWWAAKENDRFIIGAADCTGHGVPGGLMSVLGASLLSEIVIEKRFFALTSFYMNSV